MEAAARHDRHHPGAVGHAAARRPVRGVRNDATGVPVKGQADVAIHIGIRLDAGRSEGERLEWIVRPRPLFGAAVPIETWLGVPGRRRVIVDEGNGVDAERGGGEVAMILSGAGGSPFGGERVVDIRGREYFRSGGSRERRRLFTATIVEDTPVGTVFAFDATIATSFAEARERFRDRRGSHLADIAEIREGFDPGLPLVDVLVSAAITEMLEQIAADPGSPLADGLEIAIEQRFAA